MRLFRSVPSESPMRANVGVNGDPSRESTHPFGNLATRSG